jgi:uncharacterized YigZ family protein
MSEDFYYTIAAPVRAPELKVKGSRFIADIVPVETKEDVDRFLSGLRKEFFDATHHCFAYRLGPQGMLLRAADDGEPSGTAGKPILLILTSQKLTNALIVVTRYYGGTNLGTGGLARAYAESAQMAVAAAKIVRVYLMETIKLQVNYEDLQALERAIAAHEGKIADSIYQENVTLQVSLRRSMLEPFYQRLTDAFHGRVAVVPPRDTALSA